MTAPRILVFDSGMGGLTVARSVRAQLPEAHLIYAADNAGFPYGAWEEEALTRRIVTVMGELITRSDPHIIVIACNTASTIALAKLRETYDLPFVGTVPAIKPAAAQTKSGVIGVLATPGTVSREYTQALIREHAHSCEVILHGAPRLAQMAERKLHGFGIDLEMLREEVTPVFRESQGKRSDIVVLACTHYPLITDDIARVAPWKVNYLDPAPAIARRAASVLSERQLVDSRERVATHGTVLLTAPSTTPEELVAYGTMGFDAHELVEMAV